MTQSSFYDKSSSLRAILKYFFLQFPYVVFFLMRVTHCELWKLEENLMTEFYIKLINS